MADTNHPGVSGEAGTGDTTSDSEEGTSRQTNNSVTTHCSSSAQAEHGQATNTSAASSGDYLFLRKSRLIKHQLIMKWPFDVSIIPSVGVFWCAGLLFIATDFQRGKSWYNQASGLV